jgi:hypothetical protein
MPDIYDYIMPPVRPQPKDQARFTMEHSPLFREPWWRPGSTESWNSETRPTVFGGYENLCDAISICMKYLQGYHREYGSDPWYVWFPLEIVPLNIGDKIYSELNGAIYTVKSNTSEFIGVYKLEGPGQPPGLDDILYVAEEKRLNFMEGWPSAEDPNLYFTQEEWDRRRQEPWRKTVTYRYNLIEPAGHKDYFSGTREISPRQLQALKYEDGTVASPHSQRFDVEVTFDCWDLSNNGAVEVARWFREAMQVVLPVMRGYGLDQAHFIRQGQDVHITRWRNDIMARSLVYRFRLSEVKMFSEAVLNYLRTRIVVKPSGEVGADFAQQVPPA